MSLTNPEYVENYDGSRIYLLPGVPVDAGEIPVEPKIPLEKLLKGIEEKLKCKDNKQTLDRAGEIINLYKGRTLDTAAILLYAAEQGKFDEYAQLLERGHKQFSHIPSVMMWARTDITAFFLRLYLQLGKANLEDIKENLYFDEKYGPGLVVYPDK